MAPVPSPYLSVTLSENNKQDFEAIARQTLDLFESVAESARNALSGSHAGRGAESFASVNTLTSTKLLQTLRQMAEENRRDCEILAREPAIARVVYAYDSGTKKTCYVCRASPVSGMASYRAPVGRLASLPVGESYPLPDGTVQVLERALLHPARMDQVWDSKHSVLEGENYGPVTVESFLALLTRVIGKDLDEELLESLLAEERESANISEGIRRGVITKMRLRDQPILDQ